MRLALFFFWFCFYLSFLLPSYLHGQDSLVSRLPYQTKKGVQSTMELRVDVSPAHESKCRLFFPLHLQTVFKKEILVKGVNRYLTAVFVNGKKLSLRNDGRFYTTINLAHYGSNRIYITFLLPNYELLTVVREVYLASSFPGQDKFKGDAVLYSQLYHSDLFYNPHKERSLSDPFTRADMAYFLSSYSPLVSSVSISTDMLDVSSDFWAYPYISQLIESQDMFLYPDASFRPKMGVLHLSFIMGLIQKLKFQPSRYPETALPYKDLPNDWTLKYVETAFHHGLLPDKKRLDLNKVMTIYDFLTYLHVLRPIDLSLFDSVKLDVYQSGFVPYLESIVPYIKRLMRFQKSALFFSFDSLNHNQIVYEPLISLSGQIYPAQQIVINNEVVKPNDKGAFSASLDLSLGRNDIVVRSNEFVSSWNVWYLDSFSDLKGHWFEEGASKLKYLGLLPDFKTNFEPGRPITRLELSRYLFHLFPLSTQNLKEEIKMLSIIDAPQSSQDLSTLKTVLDYGFLSLDEQGYFYPDRFVNKEVAVAVLDRVLTYFKWGKPAYSNHLPYRDVHPSHWSYRAILKAFSSGLLTESDKFYPKRSIRRDELFSLFIKVEPIKKKILEGFYD